MKTRAFLLFSFSLLISGGAFAVDGKWTPEQILEHDPKWLRELGLEIPPEKLWGQDGAGLLEAAVKVDGCSAGFITAQGLLITNHHCAFGILQQHSTPERDLITNGFLAKNPAEELGGAGTRATIPHKTTDVTAVIEAAVPAGADDLARFRAIERKGKELVAECEKQPNRRCQVEAFDGGVRYLLIENLEFPDVRVVYAPPRAVGEYG
ncbi:MAG TPA: S46 family peptidase, partial [Thermoanaerobaculia bacterium]|nr:S46 family peptidase [Thermoanaerobaculia bacterium]